MSVYKNLDNCRVCNSLDLEEVITIEDQYLSPTFVESNKSNPLTEIKVPHTLLLCNDCSLLQLKETVEQDLLYKQYFYRSAVSDMMRKDLLEVVNEVLTCVNIEKEDYVVDIGANDCTMISFFPETLNRCAIEPAENIDWSGVSSDIRIANDYFSDVSLANVVGENKVKIFTSCAMFYDLDDPNSFVTTIKNSLHQDGVFCIQLSYVVAMLRNLNFYDICNEHLEYYSLTTLENLMQKNGLEIFDAKENAVNGGSVRVMVAHKGQRQRTAYFNALLQKEGTLSLDKRETYMAFHDKILDIKNKVNKIINNEIDSGNLVLGLGASTKGNMLLQTFGIGKERLPFISERNPEKVGLRTLGTDIELISEKHARNLKPSCMLVLPWYFKTEIIKRESAYIKNGGSLLFPMPYPHVVVGDKEIVL